MIIVKSLLAGFAALACFIFGLIAFLSVTGWVVSRRYGGDGSIGWDPVSPVFSWTGLPAAIAMKLVIATPFVVFASGFGAGLVYFSRTR